MTNKIDKKKIVIPIVFFFLFVLYLLIGGFVTTDMKQHARFAREMISGDRATFGNFLFYWLVNIFSFFSVKKIPSGISLCFLIAIATTFRYHLSQIIIFNSFQNPKKEKRFFWISVIISISLIFVFAIPIPSYFVHGYFLMGNFSPNVWHNSTTIFLFPFSFLLFYFSYKQLITFSLKRNFWILGMIILNILIKPSYFFVFVCIYPLFLIFRYKLNKNFWYSIIPIIVGLSLLALEYISIYITPNDSFGGSSSSVVFRPFYFYTQCANLWELPFSLFFSLLFPFSYVIFNFYKLKKSLLFQFTTLSFLVSVLIYLLLAESGPRANFGNFQWQVIICTWFCFFVSILSLIRDFDSQGFTVKNKILISIYSLHVLTGFVYLIKIFIVGNCY